LEDAGPFSSRTNLLPESVGPGKEESSLGNVRRGDWIRTSDLLNPIQEEPNRNELSDQQDTESLSVACTPACTSETKSDNEGIVKALAAALLCLSPTDRAKLAAMLIKNAEE
jgi:hypothetical protein